MPNNTEFNGYINIASIFKKLRDYNFTAIFNLLNYYNNLITIYSSINNFSPEKVIEEFCEKDLSIFKKRLSESLIAVLNPIGKEMNKLLVDDINYLNSIISSGVVRASEIAKPVIKEVYEKIGFLKI